MPYIVSAVGCAPPGVFAEAKERLRDVTFENLELAEMIAEIPFGAGDLTQHLGNTFPWRNASVAACKGGDVMTVFEKAVGEMAADESRDAGDEAMLGHARGESSRQSLRHN